MDEVYRLEGAYERFRPVRLNDGRTHNTKFLHSLDPISPQGHAAHRHPYIYDPKTNWRGGEVAARQVGGYDMARRREDIRKEGIDYRVKRFVHGFGADKDGRITREQFNARAAERFAQLDVNGDGRIGRDEIRGRGRGADGQGGDQGGDG